MRGIALRSRSCSTLAAVVPAIALMLVFGARADARVADDFYGVVAQGSVLPTDYGLMEQGGVGTLRFAIEWSQVEREPGVYDWTTVDAIVAGAAEGGVEPLPYVWASPEWLTGKRAKPPLGGADEKRAWKAFLGALIDRYRGTIRKVQIWNEPNFKLYWKPDPSPRAYAKLLRISAKTIGAHDPSVEILLGGVAPVKRGMLPWEFLEQLYDVKGIERSFDTVAVHPYFPDLFGVEFQIRQALDEIEAAGDRRARLRITELGWASEGPAQDPMTKGRDGQARLLRDAFELLTKHRRRWRITGVDWHAFQDVGAEAGEPVCSFCPGSGLFTTERQPKPAWDEFRAFAAP